MPWLLKNIAFIVLTVLYSIAFVAVTQWVGQFGASPGWVSHFPSQLAGIFTWVSLLRAGVTAMIALPVGVACARLYPRRPAVAAAAIGVLAFARGRADLFFGSLFGSFGIDGWIKLSLLLDAVVLVTVPVLVALWLRPKLLAEGS